MLGACDVEIKHARVFKQAADDRADTDVAGHVRNLRGQHAGSAHDQVDLRAFLSGLDQGADQCFVRQCVHLGDNAAALA